MQAGKSDDLRTAFIEFDADGSGMLSVDELGSALERAGIYLVRQELVTVTRHFDEDKDGGVSIEEFISTFA